jgi:hypothetical protein
MADTITLPREQLEYIRNALRSVERYGNIYRYEKHQVSPYEKIVDALGMAEAALVQQAEQVAAPKGAV